MENNETFSQDLRVQYLSLLAKYDESNEFSREYQTVGSYLSDVVDKTTDVDLLSKLKGILDYKKKVSLEKGMSK